MRHVKTILKAAVSLSLLAYLIYLADPGKIAETFLKILSSNGIVYLLVSVGLAALSVFVQTVRWNVLLSAYNIKVKLSRLFSFYLIGLFFNNFLPTSIGGDIVRVIKIVGASGDKTQGTASVIVERIVGVTSTLIMATLALAFIYQEFKNQKLLILSLILLFGLLFLLALIISERFFAVLKSLLSRVNLFKIGEKLIKLFEAIHVFRKRRDIFYKVVALSFLSQTVIVFLNYSLVMALQLPVELSYLFVVIPVTFLLTMLPSINGIGVREGGYVFLLGKVGVAGAGAISLSFVNLICFMLLSLAGALLFVFEKRNGNIEGGELVEEKS